MTYSIVARDRETGELGVAVQSHYFQVGPVVPWALAGVGAVATQSMVNVSFGPLGLEYLKAGYTAEQALKALLAGDSEPQSRQVSIVDAAGASDAGDQAAAATRLSEALRLAPEMVELSFWGGLGMAQNGMLDAGCDLMMTAVRKDPRWIETLNRLVASDRLTADLAAQI